MAESREIALAGGRHTNYSDEAWYLILSPASAEIVLEARFQSDAIERTGFPHWARTDYCASRNESEAVCRIPFDNVGELLAAARLSFIPERVWARARDECRNLSRGRGE
jgi:hypothetical protein